VKVDTHIRVSVETHRKLMELKNKMGARSVDEVVQKLVDQATNPAKAAEMLIMWLLDIRDDVKSIKHSLEKLVNILEALESRVNNK